MRAAAHCQRQFPASFPAPCPRRKVAQTGAPFPLGTQPVVPARFDVSFFVALSFFGFPPLPYFAAFVSCGVSSVSRGVVRLLHVFSFREPHLDLNQGAEKVRVLLFSFKILRPVRACGQGAVARLARVLRLLRTSDRRRVPCAKQNLRPCRLPTRFFVLHFVLLPDRIASSSQRARIPSDCFLSSRNEKSSCTKTALRARAFSLPLL